MLLIKWPKRESFVSYRADTFQDGECVVIRTDFLAGGANGLVILVEDDADLVHEADLLRIVAVQLRGVGRVDIGEEAEDGLGVDAGGLGGRDGGSCRHSALRFLIRLPVAERDVSVGRERELLGTTWDSEAPRAQEAAKYCDWGRAPFCRPPATVAKGSCRCGPDRCRGSRGMAGSLPARTLSAVSGAVRTHDGHLQRYFLQKDLATNSSPWRIDITVSDFGPFHKPCTALSLCLPACLPACLSVRQRCHLSGKTVHPTVTMATDSAMHAAAPDSTHGYPSSAYQAPNRVS